MNNDMGRMDRVVDYLDTILDYLFDHFIWVIALVIALIIVGGIALEKDEAKWMEFSVSHNCKVVGQMSDSTSIGSKGEVIFTSGKTGYLCDDGVTYWR